MAVHTCTTPLSTTTPCPSLECQAMSWTLSYPLFYPSSYPSPEMRAALQARDSIASASAEVGARLEMGLAEQAVCNGALQAAAARRMEMEMHADALERRLADALAACQACFAFQALF